MCIAKKLLEARKRIDPLRRDSENTHLGYKYASIQETKRQVKEAFDEVGIVFYPIMKSGKMAFFPESRQKQGYEMEFDMTLVDPDDGSVVTIPWFGYGTGSDETAHGKSLSYAVKTFLQTLLILAQGDEEDADASAGSAPPVMPHPDNQRNRNAQKMTSLSTQAELDKRRAWYGVTPSPWSPPPGFIGETESDWMQASIRHIDSLLSSKKIDQQAADVLAVEIEKLAKQAKPGPLTYQYLVYLQHLALDKFEPALPEQFVRIRNMAPLVPDAEARTICREKLGADHPRVLSKTDCETLIEEVAKLAATRGK